MRKYFWFLTLFVFCVTTVDATAQVTKGLHFYMPFNEGKGDVIKDVGPKGFEAELHGSAKFVKGKVGTAIEFSEGPALIIDPGGQSELYVEHLTVAVWIHPFEISKVGLGDGHVYGNIFYDKSGKSDDNVEFGLGSSQGLYWYINSGQKKMGPFNGADVDTTLSLPNLGLKPKNWYHVVGTFDGEKIQIYLDGKLEGEKDVPKNGPVMVWNDNNIEIGGRPDTNAGANLYKGLLDELAVCQGTHRLKAGTCASQTTATSEKATYTVSTRESKQPRKMFIAALTSRSCSEPHAGHLQCLSDRDRFSF